MNTVGRAIAAVAVFLLLLLLAAVLPFQRTRMEPGDRAPSAAPIPSSPGPTPRPEPPPPPAAAEPPAPPPPAPAVPEAMVAGSVVDADGRPVPGALVWAGDDPGPGGRRRVSDEEGRFELSLPAGSLRIRARGQWTGTASVEVAVPADGGRVEAPELRLPAGGVIRGRTVDRDGNPLARIRVRCWSVTEERSDCFHDGERFLFGGDDVATDEKGGFLLEGLDDGPHRVFLEFPLSSVLRSHPPEVKGVIPGGEPLLFRVAGAARLQGAVVDAATGEPIRNFSVARKVFDAPDGRFRLEVGEEPEAEVAAPGYAPVQVPVEGEANRRIEMRAAEDSGTLVLRVSGDGGEPIPGLRALVCDRGAGAWPRAWNDAAREFTFGRVFAGEVLIFLRAEGWTQATVKATVEAGATARPEVKLRRCGSARVRLFDAKGNVLRHPKSVVLRDAEGRGPPVRWEYTRPQGRFYAVNVFESKGAPEGTDLSMAEMDGRLAELLPGTYILAVDSGTLSKEAVFTVAAGEEVEVTVRLGR